MEIKKLIILLSCAWCSIASHSHIPLEGYDSELQVLGQHVEFPETPVKIIKITKTIAVKVPVPYPVKVIEKVPYPVHVAKPYPVPVPQIIPVPHGHGAPPPAHQADAAGHSAGGGAVHEDPSSYDFSPHYGYSGGQDESGSFEAKSYDNAIKEYFQKHGDGNHGSNQQHYH